MQSRKSSALKRLVVGAILALPSAFFWWLAGTRACDPGGWVVRHVVRAEGFPDAAKAFVVGVGVDFIVLFVVWFLVLGVVRSLRPA